MMERRSQQRSRRPTVRRTTRTLCSRCRPVCRHGFRCCRPPVRTSTWLNVPTIGTATVATPLLSTALTAKIILVAHAGSVPTLAILLPAPLNLQLNATPIVTGPAVQTLVIGIPDIPLSSLKLSLPGGPNSLFRAGVNLCSSPQTVSGSFTVLEAEPSSIRPRPCRSVDARAGHRQPAGV